MAAAFVDFAAVKKSVSLEQVLARSGLLDGFSRKGEKLCGPCPLCKRGGARAFQVNLAKNVWYCFGSCKRGGNVLDFVAGKEGTDLRTAARLLDDWFALGLGVMKSNEPGTSSPSETATPPAPAILPATNPPLTFALKTLDVAHPALEELGLRSETRNAFGIGYCTKGLLRGRIAIPIRNAAGELVAYTGLGLPPATPRYLFPPKFHPALEVWNLDRLGPAEERKGTLFLSAEVLDALRLVDQAVGPVLSLFDGSLSEAQEEKFAAVLNPRDRLVLMGDGFPERTVSRLARHAFVTWFSGTALLAFPSEPEERNPPMRAMTKHEANTEASKLDTLAREWGMSVPEFIEEYALDDTVPGICMNPTCEYTCAYEPDQGQGWCRVCGTPSVKSALLLAGLL